MSLIPSFFFTQKPKSMKRSIVFLGLSLMVAAGISVAPKAQSATKAARSFCCDVSTTRCAIGPGGTWIYGPRVSDFSNCW